MTGALVADNLSRSFDDDTALLDVDLEIAPRQVHAIVGLNGAGKTTLMRLLLGMLRPDAGRAIVMGVSAREAPPSVWSQVGHLIETPFAYPELTVRENAVAAATLHALRGPEAEQAAEEAIVALGLERWSDRKSRTLSLGNRQRLGLVSAFVHKPSIVVLDEPANSLDPEGVLLVRDRLKEMAEDDGAVFVSSHHLDQLARVADVITVLHRGRIVGQLDPGGTDLEQSFFDLVRDVDRRENR